MSKPITNPNPDCDYITIDMVVAVKPQDRRAFSQALDQFIEESDIIVGVRMSDETVTALCNWTP